jgi:hypothetical protein
MTSPRFFDIFCLAFLARILVSKSRIDPWRASYRGGGTHALMVKKLIFASKGGEFPRPKAHAASRS